MTAKDWLDGLGCLIGIVKRNGADKMMEDMCLDDAVEDMSANETELTIDCRRCATLKVPCLRSIVRETWVGVL